MDATGSDEASSIAEHLDKSTTEAHYQSRLVSLAAALQQATSEFAARNSEVGNTLEEFRQHNSTTLK